jgi:hypothetical protein
VTIKYPKIEILDGHIIYREYEDNPGYSDNRPSWAYEMERKKKEREDVAED